MACGGATAARGGGAAVAGLVVAGFIFTARVVAACGGATASRGGAATARGGAAAARGGTAASHGIRW